MGLMLAATDLGVDSIPAYELVKYPYILRNNLPILGSDRSVVSLHRYIATCRGRVISAFLLGESISESFIL